MIRGGVHDAAAAALGTVNALHLRDDGAQHTVAGVVAPVRASGTQVRAWRVQAVGHGRDSGTMRQPTPLTTALES